MTTRETEPSATPVRRRLPVIPSLWPAGRSSAASTGVIRFAVIGAVLGPTFFGNTYQFTNSLPNLVYYGFLAGSLFSSLLCRHSCAHRRR